MWFSGATWTTLFVAGLLMVAAFWFAYGTERRKRQKQSGGKDSLNIQAGGSINIPPDVLRRIHEEKHEPPQDDSALDWWKR